MNARAASQRASFETIAWSAACLALVLLPGLTHRPFWITGTVGAVAALRVFLASRGRGAPSRLVRFAVASLAIGLLFLEFRTFNGLAAGTALLSLIGGLKLLESDTRRDLHVVVMILYFLCLAALLQSESFWLLGYLVAVCWLATSILLRLTGPAGSAPVRSGLRYAGRLLAQSVPLALALWLFFPRFGGPLWPLAETGGGATAGLSDSMSPGDITDLAASDEVAFRVRFSTGVPPPAERYWRGPVLHEFDGRTWRRTEPGAAHPASLVFAGPAYRYTVSLEPNQQHWIFVLDWPAGWNVASGFLTADYMLLRPNPILQPLDVTATSYGRASAAEPLDAATRRRDLQLPPQANPRTTRLAQELRRAHPEDLDLVGAVLDMFRREAFFYTLRPPRLGDDSVDAFLFDSRRGFCGHYASAFAVLMRAAGIPARVVTGYQGGTYNRFAGYWILRQSDAHAWDEIWVGQGWRRIDPTAMIAPERVEHGLDAESAADPLTSRWQRRGLWLSDVRLRLDALRLAWRQRILGVDAASQDRLLVSMHLPEPGRRLAVVLGACLLGVMAWLTWQVRRELHPRPADPVARAYDRLCRRLAAVGLRRLPHEGPEDFAARVALHRPDLGPAVAALCRSYAELRYAAAQAADAASSFVAGVRAFRPRGSRGSS